ncbi:alcohol dehydrogenase catalytic domain-containing protein [Paraburkholderia acidisoli]|uniref:Alcohol dehydrogenase n=1 Tax=Paraburkholderia acidisoli TaxID=2571748 RepID=A0A7Z2GNE9_9BURK|nr:alcohol dehydrogenase catalytic domain-containing protein [Paraburkholderia acidisoli]QGZ64799.1 alcohol dehydrogenase [Paraburkholderia acidisoli]
MMVTPPAWRAWVWQGSADPRDLALETVAREPLAPGHVLVRNAVIGLNPVDWKVLGGDLVNWRAGKVPGVDGAGTVVGLGANVAAHWIGQRVAYHTSLHAPGSFAEYTPVATRALLRVPDGVDFATAASMPCPALTAWLALDKLPRRVGARVLIAGAGGAVGQYLVQLAAGRGFEVTAMSHPRHWTRLTALGATACMHGAPGSSAWLEENAGRFFAAIDSVNAEHAARIAGVLEANGHLVCIQGRLAAAPCAPFGRALSVHEVALGALHDHGDDAAWARLTQAGEALLAALDYGTLRAESHTMAAFESLAQHLHALEHRAFSGKALVAVP